jgi:hypothetical protein
LFGCETWFLTLRKEHKLRVFENRALVRIFGPKKDEIIGGCRKTHNGGLHGLHSSPNATAIISSRRISSAGNSARMKAKRNTYRVLVRKPQGKKLMGRTRHRWNDNIRMDLIIEDVMSWT